MKQVICLGSFQGSDRLGWEIAAALEQRLAEQGSADIRVRACASPAQLPGVLTELSKDTEALLIVDALAGAPWAQVRVLNPQDLKNTPAWSCHGVDLVTALELARALRDLPAQVRIVGIGVGEPAQAPMPAVEAVLPAVWKILVEAFGLPAEPG